MMLDGHSAQSVADNLGIRGTNLLYRWKARLVDQSGPTASVLDKRVQQLQDQLRRGARAGHLKKSVGYVQPDVTQIYQAIQNLQEDFPVTELCQVLNVSRSAYYDWGSPWARLRQRQDEQLSPSIEQIFNDHQRRYGASEYFL